MKGKLGIRVKWGYGFKCSSLKCDKEFVRFSNRISCIKSAERKGWQRMEGFWYCHMCLGDKS